MLGKVTQDKLNSIAAFLGFIILMMTGLIILMKVSRGLRVDSALPICKFYIACLALKVDLRTQPRQRT